MKIRGGEKHCLCRKNGVKVAQIQSGWKLESSHNAVRQILEHFPQGLSCLHLLWDTAPMGSALALETGDGLEVGCCSEGSLLMPQIDRGERSKVIQFWRIPCPSLSGLLTPQPPQLPLQKG